MLLRYNRKTSWRKSTIAVMALAIIAATAIISLKQRIRCGVVDSGTHIQGIPPIFDNVGFVGRVHYCIASTPHRRHIYLHGVVDRVTFGTFMDQNGIVFNLLDDGVPQSVQFPDEAARQNDLGMLSSGRWQVYYGARPMLGTVALYYRVEDGFVAIRSLQP